MTSRGFVRTTESRRIKHEGLRELLSFTIADFEDLAWTRSLSFVPAVGYPMRQVHSMKVTDQPV